MMLLEWDDEHGWLRVTLRLSSGYGKPMVRANYRLVVGVGVGVEFEFGFGLGL